MPRRVADVALHARARIETTQLFGGIVHLPHPTLVLAHLGNVSRRIKKQISHGGALLGPGAKKSQNHQKDPSC